MNEKKNSKTLLIAVVCIVFLGAGAWGITKAFSRPKPDETRQLLAKSKDDPGKMMDEFRNKMRDKNLTDAERDKLRESMRNVWDSRIDEAVGEYYAAKPDDREAILNKHIDEMEKWRKMREEREREEQEKAKAEGKSEEEREKEREKEREQWRKSMSDRSKEQRKSDSETRNPNKMAQRMAYMSALHKQMEARGIKPPWGGGGGGGRGFGRG